MLGVAETSRTRTIAADPTDVWAALADFGSLSSWARSVDHSCILRTGAAGGLIGTSRRLQLGRLILVERIVEVDPPRVLSYQISGLPRRLRHVANRWTLTPDEGGTRVTLTSTVEVGTRPVARVVETLAAALLATQSEKLLDDLAYRWEPSRV